MQDEGWLEGYSSQICERAISLILLCPLLLSGENANATTKHTNTQRVASLCPRARLSRAHYLPAFELWRCTRQWGGEEVRRPRRVMTFAPCLGQSSR